MSILSIIYLVIAHNVPVVGDDGCTSNTFLAFYKLLKFLNNHYHHVTDKGYFQLQSLLLLSQ